MVDVKTKKLLVAYDAKKSDSRSTEFLVPVCLENGPDFFGLKSGKYIKHGMVVFTGKDVTVNDIFSRLVGSGRKIPSVDNTLAQIGEYLQQIKQFKVGDILSVEQDSASKCGFLLRKCDIETASKKRKLP